MAIDAHAESVPTAPIASEAAAKLQEDAYSNPGDFAKILATNFKQLDLNGDGDLSKAELDARASSDRGTPIGAVASTALKHFDYLSKISGNEDSGISMIGVNAFEIATDSAQCSVAPPSFGDTVAAGAAGGAIGGGIASKASGDKFSGGAGKGAAVGAAVGLVAYGVEEANYNDALQQRHGIDSWSEFRGTICDGAKPQVGKELQAELSRQQGPETSEHADSLDKDMGVVHRIAGALDLKNHSDNKAGALSHVKEFEKVFPTIDVNHDGYLSLDELARAAASPSLTHEQQQIAAMLADSVVTVSELSGTNKYAGERISLADLDAAPKLFSRPDKLDVVERGAKIAGLGTVSGGVGCVVGALVGAAFASPEIGCPIGAAIAGGGMGFAFNKSEPPADTIGDKLGREQVNKLRGELLAVD